jgi:succinyl-CoA synthetase beta subunit/citryl-CoA synthetase large subunit
MARVLENVGKELLKKSKISVSDFRTAETAEDARQFADDIGYPVVIKALVAVGKRGKAGAVRFAQNGAEAEKNACEILNMTVCNFPVESLLVEKKLDIAQELYIAITYDSSAKMPIIIASREGGVDIEDLANTQPNRIIKTPVNTIEGFHPFQAKEIASALDLKGKDLQKATSVIWRLYKVFDQYDATILEINPLVITASGEMVAAAILMAVDDDGLYRQPTLSPKVEPGSDRTWRPLTELEKKMVAVDTAEPYRGTARYTEMEGGNIGFLCGGGGGSLLVYDALLRYGGKPANYAEFGGNPTQTKVSGLVKGVLSKPGVAGFIVDTNITNNTQTDVVAKGIVQAFQEMNINPETFPTIVRLAGINDAQARKIFRNAGVPYYMDDITMEAAARLIVEQMDKTYRQKD